jgi:hypothetical protein
MFFRKKEDLQRLNLEAPKPRAYHSFCRDAGDSIHPTLKTSTQQN